MAVFLDTLLREGGKPLTDRQWQRLQAYIQAQLAGEEYLAQFPDIVTLLDRSPELSAAYARLYELEQAAAQGEMPPIDDGVLRPPDLSFLRQTTPTDWLAELAERLVQQGEKLILALNERLLAALPAPPQVALGTRSADTDADGGGRYAQQLYTLDTAAATATPPFTLTVFADRDQPTLCLVEIEVRPAGKSWPELGGTPVRLVLPESSRQGVTDAWGVASFPDIPRAQLPVLQLEIGS